MITNSNSPSRIAWSLAEAAQAVGIGQSTLRREVSLGRLKATRLGRRIVIEDAQLRAYASGAVSGAETHGEADSAGV